MKFWDSSAVVALVVEQRGSSECRALAWSDRDVVVWWATPVECEAALARLARTGELPVALLPKAREALARLEWREVPPAQEIRDTAAAALRRYPLRAADALQLAAAVTCNGGVALGRPFVTLDHRLQSAAAAEGFEVLPAL